MGIKRLTLKSLHQVGEVGGATVEELKSVHCGDFKKGVLKGSRDGHSSFHARHWYNSGKLSKTITPRFMFTSALIAFKFLCSSFSIAMCIKILSVVDSAL